MKKGNQENTKRLGSVRIIGGEWRGRRLPVRDLPGLRPSGDRSRETLFNWLQAHIRGAVCVDLFAGSGALGLEAASRGAAEVILVEKLSMAARELRKVLLALKADQVTVVEADALHWLHSCPAQSVDIAFVDPPFGLHLDARALELIHSRDCIRTGGFIYLETARDATAIVPGRGWEIARKKTMGDVSLLLLKKI
ncbi:MAG: 16S rRNA (guanine(966)-N(2))-methyltransferase RsmD [Xanthomonadales bacterium]